MVSLHKFALSCALVASGVSLTHCGSKETKMSGNLSAAQIYFFTRPQVSGDGSAVYRLNLDTEKLETWVSKDSSSTDMRIYRDPTTQDLWVLERFAMSPLLPSKVTQYAAPSGTPKEFTALPINAGPLLRLSSGTLLTVGYQEGDLGQLNPNQTAGTATALGLQSHDKSLMGVLKGPGGTYTVSGGYDAQTFTYAKAKIHTLNAGLTAITSSQSIDSCTNASRGLAVSAQVLVLACNPQYADPSSPETVRVVKIDVSGASPVFTTLFETETSTAAMLDLGGLSADASAVLVSSLKPVFTPSYHEETTAARWVNLLNGQTTAVSGWAGKVTTTAGRMVTSCVLEGNVCKAQTFGVFDNVTSSSLPTGAPRSIAAAYSYVFDDFSNPLPSEK